jgi:hypothetical protein
VNHFGRDHDGHVQNLELLAWALHKNLPSILLDTLTGEDIMSCLEQSKGHTFHYCVDNRENEWLGIKHLHKQKTQSNIICMRMIKQISSGDDTSQGTQPTISSLDTWGVDDGDY